ncbi:MAG TPA: EAL domain-containing protein [Coleofasciculaceae cyanobacterium]|jgi:diguanylate cyclase (GGDEF)-like protein/PAS domain S-box-containing protein
MSYSRGLLKSIVGIFNYCSRRSGGILIYSLLGLNLSVTKINAEDNILVIHSYHSELSSVKQQHEGIEQGFTEIDDRSNVYHEFLDSKRHPQLEHGQEFIDYINKKYQRIPISLLMVIDDPSLQLMLRKQEKFFPNIPVVFLGIDNLRQELFDTPWLTGVMENHSVVETVLEATRQTWTDTIIIIDNTTQMSQAELAQIEAVKKIANKSLKIKVIYDLVPQEIVARLGKYPNNVPVLILGQLLTDSSSKTLIDPRLDTQILQSQIPNPIYTNDAVRLGRGAVGGKIFDSDYHAWQAVELANKILSGAKPDEVGPILTGKNRWVFDYRQLLKYNIKLDLLPEHSQLLYLEPPAYLKYRMLIFLVGFILLSSLLAIILLIEKGRKHELANKILQENEQRYKDLAKAGANVFWELDEQLRYSYISGDVGDLCGLRPSQMKGSYPPLLHQNNSQLDVDWKLFERITKAREPFKNFTFSFQDKNDGIRIFKINGKPLFDSKNNFLGYRGVKQEITAEQNLYKKIAYQATYDDLTGLLNRREFNEKLKYSVQKAQKYHTESVLCYVDLDRFKIVNDTAGHQVGDRLLSELAKLLQSLIRKEDTLGRLGGDEFGLLLEGCLIAEAEQVCEQLIRAINNYRLTWKTVEFDVGVSIGMVSIQDNSTDAAELLSRADLACYQAKNLGRGRVYIFENNDRELDLQQTYMGHIANVSQAIQENRFYLVKQLIKPLVDDGKQRRHYELLLRLKDRAGNLITPEEFIPVAERYGVITRLDRWVLEATLNSYGKYFAAGQDLVSINLSGASLNDERFTNFAIDLILKSEVPGDCLCFEISETAAIAQISNAQKFIFALKNLGVKFALDDFGSGLSSFSYLKTLPIDFLKIDGNLVKAILNEECDRAIVNSINEIAHLMGIKTIAEFVENDQILEHISKISIDYVQGYVTGKPMAIAS